MTERLTHGFSREVFRSRVLLLVTDPTDIDGRVRGRGPSSIAPRQPSGILTPPKRYALSEQLPRITNRPPAYPNPAAENFPRTNSCLRTGKNRLSRNCTLPAILPAVVLGLLLVVCVGCFDGDENAGSSNAVSSAASVDGGASVTASARFVEKTAEAGIEFTYRNDAEASHYAILESMGGGLALFDFDADGDLDLLIPGGGEFVGKRQIRGLSPGLFRNDGRWRFTKVTESARLTHAPYYSHGAATGDFDNDGFADLLITGYGGLLLFHNNGDGTFEQISTLAGLNDSLWSISAAWGDINGDGNLDLYITHYVDWSFEKHPHCPGPPPDGRDVCPPREFDPLPDVLYLSNGDGSFRDASREMGLQLEPGQCGKGIGVVMADADLDGDLDVYVGNDTVPNFFFRNEGRGRLEETALMSGTALSDTGLPDGSMGVDVGDYNGDGLPDLWVANYERESFALYRNQGNFSFQHVSQPTGVRAAGAMSVGWGTVFFDFDRDGDQDLFAANGHVVRFPKNAPLLQKPLLLENHKGTRFVDVAAAAGPYMSADHMGRGVALGDLDNDGDLDLAVSHINQPAALLSNESDNSNHWLSLQLIGIQSNRDAVGTIVRIETPQGAQTKQIKGGGSYASSSDLRLFFGLGEQSLIEHLEVRWPSGTKQVLENIDADQMLRIKEPREL